MDFIFRYLVLPAKCFNSLIGNSGSMFPVVFSRQHNNKFIAADTRDEGLLSKGARDMLAGCYNDIIPKRMPEIVID
ncbi:hypothetical protein SDC9_103330 [bioreactor metagenome]|uniref:Uncharacterized protein n=1 Tax=bioreactor metagenome TaxID=1076179 RepID=A0A645B473_9ZZZZ